MIYCKEIIEHRIGDSTPFKELADKIGFNIELNEEDVERAYDGSLWEKGYAPEKPESIKIQERAIELHRLLQESDYWSSKYVDGEYTDEEWAEKVVIRRAWREELRSLENVGGDDNGL